MVSTNRIYVKTLICTVLKSNFSAICSPILLKFVLNSGKQIRLHAHRAIKGDFHQWRLRVAYFGRIFEPIQLRLCICTGKFSKLFFFLSISFKLYNIVEQTFLSNFCSMTWVPSLPVWPLKLPARPQSPIFLPSKGSDSANVYPIFKKKVVLEWSFRDLSNNIKFGQIRDGRFFIKISARGDPYEIF